MTSLRPTPNLAIAALFDRALALFGQQKHLVLPIAGFFFFLPALVTALGVAPMPANGDGVPTTTLVDMQMQWLRANWPWLAFQLVAESIGALAIYRLYLAPGRETVGGALNFAARHLLLFLVALTIISFPVSLGAMFMILPGVFIYSRFMLIGPVIAGNGASPLDAIGESWRLTSRAPWACFALIATLLGLSIILASVFGGIAETLAKGFGGVGGEIVAAFLVAIIRFVTELAMRLVSIATLRELAR